MIHDFRTQLAWSEAGSEEPFWDAVYRKMFPNLVNHMPCPGDTASQRMGIDRLILLSNGKTKTVDEKKRSKDYGDILLEYVSVDRTGAPGWMEKDLAIDYLAYAIMPKRFCYVFPWDMLRRAWLHHRDEWLRIYPTMKARNDTYNTLSVAVPTNVLRRAVSIASLIDVVAEMRGLKP